nr:MAG TPA: hypothetical protein [Caudoviricetes sp.]
MTTTSPSSTRVPGGAITCNFEMSPCTKSWPRTTWSPAGDTTQFSTVRPSS